jgi:hypothetical protein
MLREAVIVAIPGFDPLGQREYEAKAIIEIRI